MRKAKWIGITLSFRNYTGMTQNEIKQTPHFVTPPYVNLQWPKAITHWFHVRDHIAKGRSSIDPCPWTACRLQYANTFFGVQLGNHPGNLIDTLFLMYVVAPTDTGVKPGSREPCFDKCQVNGTSPWKDLNTFETAIPVPASWQGQARWGPWGAGFVI